MVKVPPNGSHTENQGETRRLIWQEWHLARMDEGAFKILTGKPIGKISLGFT